MNLFELFFKIGAKDEASGVIQKLSAGFKGFAAAAGVAVGAAVAGMGKFAASAVQTGQEFDQSMSQVYATMGNIDDMSAKSFEKLKESAQALGVAFDETTTATELSREVLRQFAQEEGRTTAFSATQAADALNYMALAGYDANESLAMLPTVLDLAAAGSIDLARASDMITDAQTALGLTFEETSTMVDQMAKAASKSNTSVEQLGDAILTIGGTAQFMAGGTERLNTVLGILADNGIKGAEAGTHLRNMLLKLSAPTSEGTKAMQELGLEVFDSSGKMRDMQEIVQDLGAAMEGMSDEKKIQYISDIFNARDVTAVNALLGTTKERWEELGNAIENSSGAAQEMANIQLDNLAGDITLFKSALEGAKIAVSDVLTPSLREFVQFGTEGISRLTQAFKEDGLSGAMGVFGEVLSEGVGMIVKNIPMIVDGAVDMVMAFAGGIIDNTDTILDAFSQIITLLVQKAEENLPQVVEAFVGTFAGVITAIAEVIPQIASAFVELVPELVRVLSEQLPVMIDAYVQLLLAIMDAIPQVITAIAGQIPTIVTAIVNALLTALPQLLNGAITMFMAIVEAIPIVIEQIVPMIPTIVDSIVSALLEMLPALLDGAVQLFMAIVDAIPLILDSLLGALPQIIETINTGFTESFPQLLEAAIQLFMAIVQAIPQIIDSLTENLPEIINTIINTLIENIPMLLDGAIQLFMAIIQALPTIIRALTVNLPRLITTIVTTLLSNLPVIISAAVQLLMGIIQAIPQITKELISNVPQIIETIVDGLSEGFDDIVSVGSALLDGIWSGIKSGASTLWSNVKGWAMGLLNDLKGLFGIHSPSRVFRDQIGKMLAAGMGVGFDQEFPKVESDIESQMDGLVKDLDVGVIAHGDARLTSSSYGRYNASGNNESRIIKLYLDGDKLVGETADRMDSRLGNKQEMKLRWEGAL